MWVSLAFDGIVAILLGVTIFYCYRVSQRLSALRSGKDELKQVIEDLTVATTKAQMSIAHLKEAGQNVVTTLEKDVRSGRVLADELSLMLEAGNNLADRLEGSRDRGRLDEVAKAVKISPEAKSEAPMKALQDRVAGAEKPETAPAKASATAKAKASEGTLENELLKALRRAR